MDIYHKMREKYYTKSIKKNKNRLRNKAPIKSNNTKPSIKFPSYIYDKKTHNLNIIKKKWKHISKQGMFKNKFK
jgi:hypothetical protein